MFSYAYVNSRMFCKPDNVLRRLIAQSIQFSGQFKFRDQKVYYTGEVGGLVKSVKCQSGVTKKSPKKLSFFT